MRDWTFYQENSLNSEICRLLKYFVNHYTGYKTVVDLGCGAGNEVVYMLKKGFYVTAIDRQLNKNYILDRIDDSLINKVSFIEHDFVGLNIPKCDLLMSFFSIPFCKLDYFDTLWDNIYNSINDNGYFIGQLFGERDDLRLVGDINVFSREEALKYLNRYELLYFKEFEFVRETDNKKWHFFNFIVRKK